jgi:hypothetical protein
VKPDRKRLKSDRAANRILPLTPVLHNAAEDVVHAYDAFDWDELRKAELDVVFLKFEAHDGLDRADALIHQLASANLTFIVGTRQRCLRHSATAPGS